MLTRNTRAIWLAGILSACVLIAGCGSSSSSSSSSASSSSPSASSSSSSTAAPAASSSTAAAPPSAGLGTPKKATGSPLVFGLINDDLGPVTFPEVQLAEKAAASYINNYLGGINNHPIQIDECSNDGTPAGSARCANQILDKHPVAILGGADTGATGAISVWQRANLAYLGGLPFTPAESNYTNGVIFISVSVADNAAAVAYEKQQGVKSATILATADSQGLYTGAIIANVMAHEGIKSKTVPVSPAAADFTSPAALATGNHPDLIYLEVPNNCPGMLKGLKSIGSTAKIAGIDPCTSPPALAAAGSAAEGLVFAQPFVSLDSGDPQAGITAAAIAKYAPKTIALDSPAFAGFNTVMNVQAALSKIKGALNTKSILAAFTTGSNHPNWMAHPYTCDRKQVPGQAAVCDGYQIIKQVKGGKIVTISKFLTGAQYYKPGA